MKKLSALILAVLMLMSVMAGCVKTPDPTTKPNANVNPTDPKPTDPKNPGNPTDPANPTNPSEPQYEIIPHPEGDFVWKTSASVISTSWNPHTYQTTDQSVPLDYTTSGLYTFIFNDELHPVEGKAPYEGYYIMPEMADELPIDVTAEVKANYPQFADVIPADINEGYAYKIVLNPDACWDDGTPINAETYVESFKRLLRPELLNYRASNWYGQSLSLAGAENYFNQGKTTWYASSDVFEHYSEEIDDQLIFAMGPELEVGCYIRDGFVGFPDSYDLAKTIEWLTANYGFPASADDVALIEGKTLAEIKADESLKAIWETVLGWWQTEPDEELHFFISCKSYEDNFSWDNVGIIATGEYELIIVLEKALAGFDLLYNLSGLTSPLVKIDLYDSLLKSEIGASGDEVWSSTYNTSAETTVSYGPYKMSEYQLDKSMRFVRNEKWWGYHDNKHIYKDPNPDDGGIYQMYQTTEVYIQLVSEASVRKTMFMAGQLMGYGLQAADFDELRNSERCYATPGATIFFMVLNGNMDAIQERENAEDFDKATQDLEMLTNTTFHKAMGMTYDKDDFASTISPSRSGALGIIGDAYMYDPDTGARYRDTDQAKQVLCDFYGVDVSKYASLDEAVATITGYNPEQAKVLFTQSFAEGIEAGFITDADGDGKSDQTVIIEYSMSAAADDFMNKTIEYLNKNLATVLQGTPFEGKVLFTMSAPYGDAWSDKLKAGQADVALCGWSGSLLDPFGLTDLYTNPAYQYDAAWFDATKVDLTINVPVNGENKDVTLNLKQWSDVLNGTAIEKDGVTYNYGSGMVDVEVRLDILAACEGAILESYNYLPMLLDGSMALLSYQVFYVVEEYNPIMGRGGLAYTRYNYNEAEWAAFVAEQGGELDYA